MPVQRLGPSARGIMTTLHFYKFSRQAWRQNFKLNLEFTGTPASASELYASRITASDDALQVRNTQHHPMKTIAGQYRGSFKAGARRHKHGYAKGCSGAKWHSLGPWGPFSKGLHRPLGARSARIFSFHPLFVPATLSLNGLPPPSARLSQLTLTCN